MALHPTLIFPCYPTSGILSQWKQSRPLSLLQSSGLYPRGQDNTISKEHLEMEWPLFPWGGPCCVPSFFKILCH